MIPTIKDAKMWAMFHKLWSAHVGAPGYVKQDWTDLENAILDATILARRPEKSKRDVGFYDNHVKGFLKVIGDGEYKLSGPDILFGAVRLQEILADVEKLERHVGILEEMYSVEFPYPPSRAECWEGEAEPAPVNPGFAFDTIPSMFMVQQISESGVTVLSPQQVRNLLLNPFALRYLSDYIRIMMPPFWMDLLAAAGHRIIERMRLRGDYPTKRSKP